MIKKYITGCLFIVLLSVASCGTKKNQNLGAHEVRLRCPETGLMHFTEKAVITNDAGQVISQVSLHDFSGACKFPKNPEDKAVMVDIDLTFYAETVDPEDGKMPALIGGMRKPDRKPGSETEEENLDAGVKNFDYFVTILSPDEEILAKSVFSAAIELDKSVGSAVAVESLQQRIPLPDLAHAGAYKIIFGLQLTPAQLAYNRKHGISR